MTTGIFDEHDEIRNENAEHAGDLWRERAKVAEKCPFNAVHGGCHYPDCKSDCPGRPVAVTSGELGTK